MLTVAPIFLSSVMRIAHAPGAVRERPARSTRCRSTMLSAGPGCSQRHTFQAQITQQRVPAGRRPQRPVPSSRRNARIAAHSSGSATNAARALTPRRRPAWSVLRSRPAGPATHKADTFRWAVQEELRAAVCDFASNPAKPTSGPRRSTSTPWHEGKDHPQVAGMIARPSLSVCQRSWRDGTTHDPDLQAAGYSTRGT